MPRSCRRLPKGARWVWVDQPAGSARGRSWPAATFALAVKDGLVVEAAPDCPAVGGPRGAGGGGVFPGSRCPVP